VVSFCILVLYACLDCKWVSFFVFLFIILTGELYFCY
jgi:hypothetical protein